MPAKLNRDIRLPFRTRTVGEADIMSVAGTAPGTEPRLLERMALALRARHYSLRTERTYLMWVRRYIFFHSLRHPAEMGEREINKGGCGNTSGEPMHCTTVT